MIVLTNSKGSTMNLPINHGMDEGGHSETCRGERACPRWWSHSWKADLYTRSFTLSGSLYIGDKDANNDFYDDLKKFLEFQPIEVDRGYDRHIFGICHQAYPATAWTMMRSWSFPSA